jgi:hypothetical protein
LLRVYKLVEFGHFLASIPDTGVCYDSEQKLFSISSETGEVCGEISEEKIKETAAANVSVAFLIEYFICNGCMRFVPFVL